MADIALKAALGGSLKSLAPRIGLRAPCGRSASHLSVRLAQPVASPVEGDPFIRGIVNGNPVVGVSEVVEAWAWAAIGAQLGGGAQTLTLAGAELLRTRVGEGRI